jgi:hypothetical protein
MRVAVLVWNVAPHRIQDFVRKLPPSRMTHPREQKRTRGALATNAEPHGQVFQRSARRRRFGLGCCAAQDLEQNRCSGARVAKLWCSVHTLARRPRNGASHILLLVRALIRQNSTNVRFPNLVGGRCCGRRSDDGRSGRRSRVGSHRTAVAKASCDVATKPAGFPPLVVVWSETSSPIWRAMSLCSARSQPVRGRWRAMPRPSWRRRHPASSGPAPTIAPAPRRSSGSHRSARRGRCPRLRPRRSSRRAASRPRCR